jgi:integrase
MASAWINQDPRQVQKHGTEGASWVVNWYDPEGRKQSKSCGAGPAGKRTAERLRRKIEAELMTGTYRKQIKTTWATFRQEYEERVLAGLAPRTRGSAKSSLDAFERHIRPVRVFCVGTATIDEFIAKRRQDPGDKKGSTLSPHSLNHDLRHIKAALSVAHEWGYLPTMPKVRMEKAVKKLPRYVTGDHFAAIYKACDTARFPQGQTYTAGDWWRALVTMGFMTEWRIGDMLGLRRDDVDLDAGTAVTRGDVNKGKRDELVKLHPVVIDHLRRVASFSDFALPWPHDPRTAHTIFAEIHEAAGIHLPCNGKHEHTRFCHVYGFHDLRRAFATMNADKLTPDALQTLMRHKSYQTTQVYINLTRQMDAAVNSLHVPDILKVAK